MRCVLFCVHVEPIDVPEHDPAIVGARSKLQTVVGVPGYHINCIVMTHKTM